MKTFNYFITKICFETKNRTASYNPTHTFIKSVCSNYMYNYCLISISIFVYSSRYLQGNVTNFIIYNNNHIHYHQNII